MKFGSVCSGIEAASVAWEPLGWEAAFFSEIEKFPCQLLKNHYPDVPNFGDMTKFKEWPDVSINLLCGGTPCQSFSIDAIAPTGWSGRTSPVCFQVTTDETLRRFWDCSREGSFQSLVTVGETLESSPDMNPPMASPIECLTLNILEWPSDAVLFERESLSGHPAPSRETGQKVTGTLSARTGGGGGLGTDFECSEGLQVSAHRMVAFGEYADDNTASAIKARDYKDAPDLICSVGHTLKGEGFDASEDGTGRQNLVPIAFDSRQDPVSSEKVFGALGSSSPQAQAVAYGVSESPDLAHCLRAGASKADKHESTTYIKQNMAVRRLTPIECERLQGFPDNYTRISEKPADGPRYKALGNSWAVPNVRWIGQRIQMVEDILKEKGKK